MTTDGPNTGAGVDLRIDDGRRSQIRVDISGQVYIIYTRLGVFDLWH